MLNSFAVGSAAKHPFGTRYRMWRTHINTHTHMHGTSPTLTATFFNASVNWLNEMASRSTSAVCVCHARQFTIICKISTIICSANFALFLAVPFKPMCVSCHTKTSTHTHTFRLLNKFGTQSMVSTGRGIHYYLSFKDVLFEENYFPVRCGRDFVVKSTWAQIDSTFDNKSPMCTWRAVIGDGMQVNKLRSSGYWNLWQRNECESKRCNNNSNNV